MATLMRARSVQFAPSLPSAETQWQTLIIDLQAHFHLGPQHPRQTLCYLSKITKTCLLLCRKRREGPVWGGTWESGVGVPPQLSFYFFPIALPTTFSCPVRRNSLRRTAGQGRERGSAPPLIRISGRKTRTRNDSPSSLLTTG